MPASILFHLTQEDQPYLPVLKPLLQGRANVTLTNAVPIAATEMVIRAKERGATCVVSTSEALLRLLFPGAKNPKISDYAGSFLTFKDMKFLFVSPLDHLVKTPTGKFILKRFLDKVLAPGNWIPQPAFRWELYHPSKTEELLSWFDSCLMIAVDIETVRDDPNRSISCVGYCGAKIEQGQLILRTVVVPLDDPFNVLFVRAVNDTATPKVFQNGKYDLAYFFRYNCPPVAYTFDTINLFHSWLAELPKDLGFIPAFMLKDYCYHKNDGKSGDKMDYYQYNAMDCYVTVLSCIALLLEMPEYAVENFFMEFPVVFPSHLMDMTGIRWDAARAGKLKEKVEKDMEAERRRLEIMVASPGFNPNSPKQVLKLFHILGAKEAKSTDAKTQDKIASFHPLNKRIITDITSYRENMKLRGSYFKDSVSWLGRCFYSINPHGTDTGRSASKESQFWCGLQIQNIPRDADDDADVTVKEAFVADKDFLFGECDYSQAEARDTAYLSGDTAYLAAVEDPTKDFHSKNASAFFGIPYEQICLSVYDEEAEEWKHKRIAKKIIDPAKRTNHGANYNMGAQVMLDTMGVAKVLAVKQILKLPSRWSLLQVCQFLLDTFDKTYPVIRNQVDGWYAKVIRDVNETGLLVGPTGWTRRCFGSPSTNKRHLNSYVAHPPQSLNAMTLNKAVMRVFTELWRENSRNLKLCAQIHDSILFQYREGHEHLAWKLKEMMRVPVMVTDTFGITRELIVPVDLKMGGKRWSEVEKVIQKKSR